MAYGLAECECFAMLNPDSRALSGISYAGYLTSAYNAFLIGEHPSRHRKYIHTFGCWLYADSIQVLVVH